MLHNSNNYSPIALALLCNDTPSVFRFVYLILFVVFFFATESDLTKVHKYLANIIFIGTITFSIARKVKTINHRFFYVFHVQRTWGQETFDSVKFLTI